MPLMWEKVKFKVLFFMILSIVVDEGWLLNKKNVKNSDIIYWIY